MNEFVTEFYIASALDDGAAVRYGLLPDGSVRETGRIPMPHPVWLDLTDGVFRAVLRAPFADSPYSGVGTYDLKTGELAGLILSTGGLVACHLAVDGGDVYAANYTSGDLIRLPDRLVRHSGTGPNPSRQEGPHVHSVFLSPDKKYLLSCDLGLDTLFVYDRELNEVSRAAAPAGVGPRHLVFSADGTLIYLVNEMGGSVSVYSWDGTAGRAACLHTLSAMPDGTFAGTPENYNGKGSAIRISAGGGRLYVTDRESNTVSVYGVRGEELTLLQRVSSFGDHPRDFLLLADEKYAVCTNQFGGCFVIYRVEEDGTLTYLHTEALPQAIAALELNGEKI